MTVALAAFGGAAYVVACGGTTVGEDEPTSEAQQAIGGLGEVCNQLAFPPFTYYCNSGLTCCTTTGGGFTVRRCRNVTNDVNNCGGCGIVCPDPPHMHPACSSSICFAACDTGFANCDGEVPFSGCETNLLTDDDHCGSCGVACNTAGGELCSNGVCVCPSGQTSCSGVCVDLDTDLDNCGGCDNSCPTPPHTQASCTNGTCSTSCLSGFTDCTASPGCETNLDTDVDHCGLCTTACSFPHASASCVGGSCVMGSCDAGWADCNASSADGCETQIGGSDPSNCGSCGGTCPTGTCVGGACSCSGLSDCAYLGPNGRCCPVDNLCRDVGNPCSCGNACATAGCGTNNICCALTGGGFNCLTPGNCVGTNLGVCQ